MCEGEIKMVDIFWMFRYNAFHSREITREREKKNSIFYMRELRWDFLFLFINLYKSSCLRNVSCSVMRITLKCFRYIGL